MDQINMFGNTPFRPKAVIFDLDGTLIDTEKYYRRCWPKAVAEFGHEMTDEMVLNLRSLGRPYAPARLKEWFGEDFDYYAAREVRKRYFEECVREEGIHCKKGAVQLLTELRRQGIITAIATATDPERAGRYLEAAGLTGLFDQICSATQVPNGKPDPGVYQFACTKIGCEPADCFAVEDAPNGIRSAYAAGCKVIFVPDQTEREPEIEHMMYAQVPSLAEILIIISQSGTLGSGI